MKELGYAKGVRFNSSELRQSIPTRTCADSNNRVVQMGARLLPPRGTGERTSVSESVDI
jgi:hypothetical protein